MVKRLIKPILNKSFFLFGARGTGKSTWLKSLSESESLLTIDLLDPRLRDELGLNPERFLQLIQQSVNRRKTVVIDEVQKLPILLDYVHSEIHKNKRRFILTGSSARRLKQKGVNLLAGRAAVYRLFPFSALELKKQFNLIRCLEVGAFPEAYLAKTPEEVNEYLSAYVLTYLEKEIQQEQWVRKIEPFRKFLGIAAQMNGKILNILSIAREVGVDHATIKSYFDILEDTLIGFYLPAFHRSVRKAQRMSPKFYLIDPGLKRAQEKTLNVPLLPQTSAYGEAFEHWVILEFYKYSEYNRRQWSFSYLRTKDGVEIDLIIERPGRPRALVEIKSKTKVADRDARSLETLGLSIDSKAEHFLLSLDPLHQKFGKTHAYFWLEGLLAIGES